MGDDESFNETLLKQSKVEDNNHRRKKRTPGVFD